MLFERAARMKLRFPCKGSASVEDLWDMSVEELDALYGSLKKESAPPTDSLLGTSSAMDEHIGFQIEIVRHIVLQKLQERENHENAAAKKAQKQRLLGLIVKKKDEALEGQSIEELTAMVDAL